MVTKLYSLYVLYIIFVTINLIMKNKKLNSISYPQWAGSKLEYLYSDYEKDGKTYYRISCGFAVSNIGGSEDELIQTVEDTIIQKLIGLKHGIDLTTIKGCHKFEDDVYCNVIAYFLTAEDQDLETAKSDASNSCYSFREVFITNLKADTERIDFERHGWIFDKIDKKANNHMSSYLGQPKTGQDYANTNRSYISHNNKSNEALTSTIYSTMQDKEYLLMNTVHGLSKSEILNIKKKIFNLADLYTLSSSTVMSDGLSTGLPMLFGINNGEGTAIGDAQTNGINEGNTKTVTDSNGIVETKSHTNGKTDGTNSMDAHSNGYGESYQQGYGEGNSISAGASVGLGATANVSQTGNSSHNSSAGNTVNETYSDSNGENHSTNTSDTNSNAASKTHSIGNGITRAINKSATLSKVNSATKGLSIAAGVNISESKSQMAEIIDTQQKAIVENLELLSIRIERGLNTNMFMSEIVGICEDEKTRNLLDETVVGSLAGGETQPFMALDLDKEEEDKEINRESISCFKPINYENDDILEQGKYLTLINAEEAPLMYPPNVSLVGYNARKDVAPSEYFRNQNTVPKDNIHHLAYCVDPNTMKKTNIPIDLISRMSTAILGTTSSGKSTLTLHHSCNYLEKFPGSKLIIFNNKFSDNFYDNLKYMVKDGVKVKIYALGDLSGESGTPFYSNMFLIPEGISLNEWVKRIAGVLCKAVGQKSRTLSYLTDILTQIFNEVGIFDTTEKNIHQLLQDEEFLKRVNLLKSNMVRRLENEEDLPSRKKARLETKINILKNLLDGTTKPTQEVGLVNRQNARYLQYEDLNDTIQLFIKKFADSRGGRIDAGTQGTFEGMQSKFSSKDSGYAFKVIANQQVEEDPLEKVLKDDSSVVVFNTSGMTPDEREIIGEIMIGYIYYWVFKNKKKNNIGCKEGQISINLMIEEADIFFKSNSTEKSGDSVIDNEIWTNIADEGRSSGFFYTIITQNPKDLPPALLSQCKNFLVMKLADDDNKQSILKSMGYSPERFDSKLLYWLTQQPLGMATYKCTDASLNDSKPLLMHFKDVY